MLRMNWVSVKCRYGEKLLGLKMGTVDKALSLLDRFSDAKAEFGLTELACQSGYDKATTHRLLAALQRNGFIEQDTISKSYRLGAGLVRLARLRERTFPMARVVQGVLDDLVAATGETAHVSEFAGSAMANVGTAQSPRPTRVIVDSGEPLPLHASASGLAYLAYCSPDEVKHLLAGDLKAYTAQTLTDPSAIQKEITEVRKNGYALCHQTYQTEVIGIAAPYFNPDGKPRGAVAIATPLSRFNKQIGKQMATLVCETGKQLTNSLGGTA